MQGRGLPARQEARSKKQEARIITFSQKNNAPSPAGHIRRGWAVIEKALIILHIRASCV